MARAYIGGALFCFPRAWQPQAFAGSSWGMAGGLWLFPTARLQTPRSGSGTYPRPASVGSLQSLGGNSTGCHGFHRRQLGWSRHFSIWVPCRGRDSRPAISERGAARGRWRAEHGRGEGSAARQEAGTGAGPRGAEERGKVDRGLEQRLRLQPRHDARSGNASHGCRALNCIRRSGPRVWSTVAPCPWLCGTSLFRARCASEVAAS